MGQKVHPIGFRIGTTENWRSRWYADKDYKATLKSDLAIRKFLTKRLKDAALSRVEIERAGDKVKVVIYTARPGIVIGKKGTEIDNLRKEIEKVAGKSGSNLSVEVIEIKRRARRNPGCPEHRRTARAARRFPSRHAQGGSGCS